MSDSSVITGNAAGQPPAGFHRLKPRSSVRGGFLLALFITLVWTFFTTLLVVALAGDQSRDGDKTPVWFALIFFGLNALLFFWLGKSFLRWLLTGQTTVDVSLPTAFPGEPLEVIVSQPGRFVIDKCTVDLICEEKASYTAGTDKVTKTEIVRTMPLCDLSRVEARNGKMLTRQTVMIPADAMLSFKAANNEINWVVRVIMIIPRRPDTEQLFPVRVLSREAAAGEGEKNG